MRPHQSIAFQSLELGENSEEITYDNFLNLIHAGNSVAVDIFNETAAHIGELLATALIILSPDRVVLSSEMCRLGDLFKYTVESVVEKELPPAYPVTKPQIEYINPNRYLSSRGAAISGLHKKFYMPADIT